jgi:hypothetical protein
VENLVIGGSVLGGSASGNGTMRNSGALLFVNVGNILIKGSLIAGADASTGSLTNSGGIAAEGTIGSLTIKGSVTGSATHRSNISAVGPGTAPAGATQELAIGKLSIGGNVANTNILAGYGNGADADGDASIGSVAVKGDWLASSISAGVKDMNGNGFGNADDAVSAMNNAPAIVSRIASIVIGGSIGGSATAGDTFGFVAQQIGIVKIAGSTVFTGTAATDAAKAIPNITNDLFIREVA